MSLGPGEPPVIVTGQQIGAGWSPALAVVKALAALAEARRTGARAVHWLADEDHDRAEVARVVGWQGDRLVRHRFRFEARPGTAAGWLPWTAAHQAEAEALWGPLPVPEAPTLRGHALALGTPLWALGIHPFSPTTGPLREAAQETLVHWRALDLEVDLAAQADRLAAEGAAVPLDPRVQAAWFALDPRTGLRRRLAPGEALAPGHWLSPGAALRPLLQSLLLPVAAVVLGPAERAYWRLCEPLWARVGLAPPRILDRPSVWVAPRGSGLTAADLDLLRAGDWPRLTRWPGPLPSEACPAPGPDPAWPPALQARFRQELDRTRHRLASLDRRLHREAAARRWGGDPERLRQGLFPFGRPQERVLPGWSWLRDPGLLEAILARLDGTSPRIVVEAP